MHHRRHRLSRLKTACSCRGVRREGDSHCRLYKGLYRIVPDDCCAHELTDSAVFAVTTSTEEKHQRPLRRAAPIVWISGWAWLFGFVRWFKFQSDDADSPVDSLRTAIQINNFAINLCNLATNLALCLAIKRATRCLIIKSEMLKMYSWLWKRIVSGS